MITNQRKNTFGVSILIVTQLVPPALNAQEMAHVLSRYRLYELNSQVETCTAPRDIVSRCLFFCNKITIYISRGIKMQIEINGKYRFEDSKECNLEGLKNSLNAIREISSEIYHQYIPIIDENTDISKLSVADKEKMVANALKMPSII